MGMVAGPHGLQLIPESDIRTLRFVDELSLAFIAFTAGGKLLLGQLQRRIQAVFFVTVGLVVFEYVIGSGTVVLLAPHIGFMSEMDHLQCLAVGLMAGALVIARSPASAIAIVRELRCEKGRFTQLILGVTVIMDLVVICLFALTSLVSDALLSQTQRVGTLYDLNEECSNVKITTHFVSQKHELKKKKNTQARCWVFSWFNWVYPQC